MKYIIDIPNEDVGRWVSGTPYGLRLFVPLSIEDGGEYHIKTEIPVEPYIEPVRKAIEDKVWEFVNFLENKLKASDYDFIFDDNSPYDKYTYQEAKAKYEAWLKQKDDEESLKDVTALADKIGIHKLYALVREMRGEE